MLKRTRRVAAATIVLPLALLTACSSDTPAPTANPTAAGTSAGSATTPATSTAAPTHGDRDSFVAALLAGSTKMTTAHVEMAMEIEGQAVTMSGDMTMAGASPAMQMTMDMGEAMSLDMILLESSLFLKGIPGLEPGKWAKVAVTGAMAEEFEKSLQQADPAQLAATYEKAVKDVKFVGAEEVDGEPVQHYEVTMDTKALGDTLPQDAKDLPDTVVYDMWLDADNRLRQVVYSVAGAEVEMKMSNYGEPVDISAPPAADVVEVPNS